MKRSHLEERIAWFIKGRDLPAPVREFRFAPPRMWRFDFAWPELGIALEVEGGEFMHGRHNRGMAMSKDAEKYNAAALAGWYVFRVTTKMFEQGAAFDTLTRALATRITYTPSVLTERLATKGPI